jgi:transcriptional regulator with XRE-family HTH domain
MEGYLINMSKRYLKLASILKELLFEKNMKSADLARAVDLPPPTIHRLVTGKSTRPYESSLKPIADFFSIDVEQLLGEKPLFISDSSIDENNQSKVLNKRKSKSITSDKTTEIKLIPWNQIKLRQEQNFSHKIPFWGQISITGFATLMPDTSMEPVIQKNSILVFDPEVQFVDRSYILVKLYETNSCLVRQILIDADHRYLKPLNPDLSGFKMRLLHEKDEFIATLIEVRLNCRPEVNTEAYKELDD